MKKLSYLFSALAITAMVGCSSDDVVQQQTAQASQTTRAISFSPLMNGATTRSQVYHTTADMTSFKVIGLWEQAQNTGTKVYIAGEEQTVDDASSSYSIYSQQFTNQGIEEVIVSSSGWNFRDGKTRYWPYKATYADDGTTVTGYTCVPLAFRAVSPSNLSGTAYADADNFMQTGALSDQFHYNYTKNENGEWIKNTQPVAVADMKDVCFAQTTNATSGSAVTLDFQHAFTQVVFKAKKTSNYQVDIQSIKIGGVKYCGQMNFTNYKDGEVWHGNIEPEMTIYPGFASTTPISLSSAADEAPVQLTEKGQELLLIPQTVNKWTPASGAAVNSSTGAPTGGFIAVTFRYRLTGSSEWITGTAETAGYETTYFPLQAQWAKGKRFNYTLLFGGAEDNGEGTNPGGTDNPDPDNGYDEDGTPKAPSVAITFNPTVSDWIDYKIDVTQ